MEKAYLVIFFLLMAISLLVSVPVEASSGNDSPPADNLGAFSGLLNLTINDLAAMLSTKTGESTSTMRQELIAGKSPREILEDRKINLNNLVIREDLSVGGISARLKKMVGRSAATSSLAGERVGFWESLRGMLNR